MNDTSDWYARTPVTDRCVMLTEAEETLPSNAFVVLGEGRNLLVDTGLGVGDLRGFVRSAYVEQSPLRVLLTHSHWDHIGNAHQFDRVLAHPREVSPDGTVGIDTLSEEFVDRPGQFVREQREREVTFPDGFDAEAFSIPDAEGVRPIEEGDEIRLGDRVIEVVEIPGHSPGQLAFLDESEGVLLGGDIIHVDHNAYAHFDDSDVDAYIDSLQKLIDLRDAGAFETLATSHNPPIRGDGLDELSTLKDGLERIQSGELETREIDTPWGKADRAEIGESVVLV